jgi:hypothetical protein
VLFCGLIVVCGVLVLGLSSDMKYFIYLDNMKLARGVVDILYGIMMKKTMFLDHETTFNMSKKNRVFKL